MERALQLDQYDTINVMKRARWRGGELHFRTSFRFIRTIKRGQHLTYADTRHVRGIPSTRVGHFVSLCVTRVIPLVSFVEGK